MGCLPFLPIILIKDQVLNFCRPGSILLGISWCKSFSPQTLHRQNKHAESWILSKRSLTVKPVVFYLNPAVTRNYALSRPDLEEKRLLVIILTNIDLFIVWSNIPQRGLSIVSLQSPFLEAISHSNCTVHKTITVTHLQGKQQVDDTSGRNMLECVAERQ